jgi:beta-1,4-mannosyl-glycoprotein beta-1,4-N-acetylglucosaminyltransferase
MSIGSLISKLFKPSQPEPTIDAGIVIDDPQVVHEIADYRKTIKVYDVITFFNELELLEIRLNILAPYVDKFVIIEATETFSGKPKPLVFKENQERFKQYSDKIVHYVTDDTPVDEIDLRKRLENDKLSKLDREIIENALTSDNVPKGEIHWLKEFYQKESIKKALVGLEDNDICFIGDVDEIWKPATVIDFRKDDIFKLRQTVYAYFLNNRSSEPWAGTLVTKYKNVKNNCLNHLRTVSKTKYTYVKNGGWHFTNQGGADRIRKKLESYGHQEFNNPTIKEDIENKINSNKDFIGRNFKFRVDDSGLPVYLKENKKKYRDFFTKESE